MLAFVLVVGAAGYAGIRGLMPSIGATAKVVNLTQADRMKASDRVVARAAITLAAIAVLFLAVAARAERPHDD